MTMTIQFGNSDDKLTQAQWADYVRAVRNAVSLHGDQIYFLGYPPGCEPWQNCCIVCLVSLERDKLIEHLTTIRKHFRQDSIAITEGVTNFL